MLVSFGWPGQTPASRNRIQALTIVSVGNTYASGQNAVAGRWTNTASHRSEPEGRTTPPTAQPQCSP
jgi:hypothetical protein